MKGLIFVYVMTYGGAIVSLFNPFIGLLIYVSFSIIKPEWMWRGFVPTGSYSRIVALGLLAGWAIQGFGRWQLGRARGVVIALMGFWVWSALSAAFAPDQAVAWGFVEWLGKIVLPFLVGITTIHSVKKLVQLAWVIVLSEGYVALELNRSYFQGYNALWEEGFGFMDNNCNAIAFVTCVGLAFFLGLHVRSLWQKALAFAATMLMGHAILFSFSRGGMLALCVMGATTFFLIPKRLSHCLVLAVIALAMVRLAGPQVVQRFETVFNDAAHRDESAQSRLELWSNCWDSMQKNPVFGVGPDHWPLVAPEYGWRAGKMAHTLWLQLGAELGFPGLLFLLTFYGLCIGRLWPLARERQPVADPWVHHLPRMVIASLVGFVVAAQFVSLTGLETPYYVAMIGAGVLKLTSTTDRLRPSGARAASTASLAGAPEPAEVYVH